MGSKYKAGVPELGLPALDPLVVWREEKSYIHKYKENLIYTNILNID